jgi:hypothetical protein
MSPALRPITALHLSLWREAGEVRATGDEPHMAERLRVIAKTLLLDSGVLGFHAVHKSPLIYKVIEKEGLSGTRVLPI